MRSCFCPQRSGVCHQEPRSPRAGHGAERSALLPTLPLPRQPGREGLFEPRALSFPAARCRRASAAGLPLSAYQRVLVLFWQMCEPRASQFGFSRAGISWARWDPDVAEGARGRFQPSSILFQSTR